MTDHRGGSFYIEPFMREMVEKVIAKEKPDAVPALGQTGLNVAMDLDRHGVL